MNSENKKYFPSEYDETTIIAEFQLSKRQKRSI